MALPIIRPARNRWRLSSNTACDCSGLSGSMVGDIQAVSITVLAHKDLIPSAKAVSFGLIVTGLVINALKHTFPAPK